MFCDDCNRQQDSPTIGPQTYGRCSVCGIMRACFGAQEVVSRREHVIHGTKPTNWLEPEDVILRNPTLRRDLQHLLAHGRCNYEISRQLYNAFKAAHGGVAPENMTYTVRKHPKHGSCHYETTKEIFQIKDTYDHDGKPVYVMNEKLVVKSIKNANNNDPHAFEIGDRVGGSGSAMQELTRWLNTPEGQVHLRKAQTATALHKLKVDDRKRRIARMNTALERAKAKLAGVKRVEKVMARLPEAQRQKVKDLWAEERRRNEGP